MASSFGGTSLYIRKVYNYEKREEYCNSLDGVAESVFIEIKSEKSKNAIIGCIYRHHCKVDKFMKNFFEKLVNNICKKENNKICVLMGDFNIDLLKTESDHDVSNFYDFYLLLDFTL